MAFDVETPLPSQTLPAIPGTFGGVVKAVRRNPLGALAGLACVLMVLLALFGPSIAPYSANDTSFPRLAQPSLDHPFGTDNLFRDMFSRVLVGARNSLGVGFAAVFVSTLIGIILGIGSGYLGGAGDLIVSRIMDIMLAYPGLVFLIFVVTIFGPTFLSISVAIGLYMTPSATRIIRSATISVRHQQFIEAALSVGCSPIRIMVRHVFPNVASSIIVIATIQIGAAILAEAALSFLGMGVSSAQNPSWGRMLQETKPVWQAAWWTAVVPGFAITFTVLVFNLFGDALRDALDPRLRGSR
jgi:peptide/nickel transport system permease protein